MLELHADFCLFTAQEAIRLNPAVLMLLAAITAALPTVSDDVLTKSTRMEVVAYRDRSGLSWQSN